MEDDLKWETTSYIKSEITQQLLVGTSPNFKLRLIWQSEFHHRTENTLNSIQLAKIFSTNSQNFVHVTLVSDDGQLEAHKYKYRLMF